MNLPERPSSPLTAAAESGGWMPRVTWDALVQGDNCPICAELTAGVQSNADFHKVTDLRLSELRLAAHQNVPGYCALVCKRQVREPYELSPEERGLFFEDLMATGLALEEVFQPIKLNFELLGNLVPHLHCHILPRYYGDPWPASPVRPGIEPLYLTTDEYYDRAERIRAVLR